MAWAVAGNIKGPKGDDGTTPTVTVGTTDTGAAGSSAAVVNAGTSTDLVLNFTIPKGDKGDAGEDGAGIEIAGTVATYGDLPTTLGTGDAGKAYFVTADGDLYIWDGAAFPADGDGVTFQGPPGDDGAAATITVGSVTTGAAGSEAAVVNAGTSNAAVLNFTIPKGDKGDTGDPGADGDAGARGSNWYTGSGAPGSISGSLPGDKYLDTASGDVYELS